jgi:hypothetical protein
MSAYGNAILSTTLTVSSSAVGLPALSYDPSLDVPSASVALISADGTAGTNDVRWTCDGTTPTASVGHLLQAKQSIVIYGFSNIKKFRAIRTSSDGTLQITTFQS